MIERQRFDEKFVLIENTAPKPTRKFLQSYFKGELEIGTSKGCAQEHAQAFRTEDVQGRFTPVQMQRAEQTGNAVEVIAVQMPDEDRVNAAPLDCRPHELQLSAFTAVE